jgi:single-stranded nucleic acid binding R3H domain protein
MNPFERKVCHDVVANAGLVSESEGVEPHRHVVVLPVDDAEDEVEEAEEGTELAADEADAAAEAGATEAVDSQADAVEEA